MNGWHRWRIEAPGRRALEVRTPAASIECGHTRIVYGGQILIPNPGAQTMPVVYHAWEVEIPGDSTELIVCRGNTIADLDKHLNTAQRQARLTIRDRGPALVFLHPCDNDS